MAETEFPILWLGDEKVQVSRYSRSFQDYLDAGYTEATPEPEIVNDTEQPVSNGEEVSETDG